MPPGAGGALRRRGDTRGRADRIPAASPPGASAARSMADVLAATKPPTGDRSTRRTRSISIFPRDAS